jgi:hypothetical protein
MKGILTPHILHIVLVSRPFTRPSGLRAMSDIMSLRVKMSVNEPR